MKLMRMRVGVTVTGAAIAALLVGVGASLVAPASGAGDRTTTSERAVRPPSVIRGTFDVHQVVGGDLYPLSTGLSFGWDLGKAPRVHVIAPGAPRPAKCRGNEAHPGARPGHLCIFEKTSLNVAKLQVCNAGGHCGASASSYGAWLETFSKLGGISQIAGSWAVAPR
jgi:hypothetical protein